MNRLAKKFIIILTLMIIGVNFLCILVNNLFIERYYLKMSQLNLEKVYQEADKEALISSYKMQQNLEKEEGIIVIYVPNETNLEMLNIKMMDAFQDKGLKLSKFWLWEKDYTKLIEKGEVNKLYNQKQLEYSALIKFTTYKGGILAWAKLIPHITQTIQMINQFTTLIFIIGMVGMIILITLLVRRMTKPLTQLSILSQQIANLDFQKVEIHTKDEIEDLAHHINHMSDSLKKAHSQLEQRNRQMKALLSNISHELKTPIALIKAYALGIQDGMDDGTFLEVIILQNEEMKTKIESLLSLAKIEQEALNLDLVDISELLDGVIRMQSIHMENRKIDFKSDIEKDCYAHVSKDEMVSVLNNLLTNAIKYSADKIITLQLYKQNAICHFRIKNGIDPNSTLEIDQVWKPFYVGEASRSKMLSGTGLGLTIVKAILDKHQITYDCYIENNQFVFEMLLFYEEENIIEA